MQGVKHLDRAETRIPALWRGSMSHRHSSYFSIPWLLALPFWEEVLNRRSYKWPFIWNVNLCCVNFGNLPESAMGIPQVTAPKPPALPLSVVTTRGNEAVPLNDASCKLWQWLPAGTRTPEVHERGLLGFLTKRPESFRKLKHPEWGFKSSPYAPPVFLGLLQLPSAPFSVHSESIAFTCLTTAREEDNWRNQVFARFEGSNYSHKVD